MIRVAKVKDNKDEKKLGRVKVEIIPELKGMADNLLPWANPEQHFDASKDFSQNIPDKDTYILVEVNDTWTHFSYNNTRPFSDKTEGLEAAYNFIKNNLTLYTISEPEPVKIEYSSTPEYLKFEDKTNGQLGIIFSNGRYLYWSGNTDKKMIFGYKDIKYMEISENGAFTFLLQKDDSKYSSIKLDENGNFNLTTDIEKPEGKNHTLDMKANGSFKFYNGKKKGYIEYNNNGDITVHSETSKSDIKITDETGNIDLICTEEGTKINMTATEIKINGDNLVIAK